MSFQVKFIPEAGETYNDLVTKLRDRWGDKFATKFEDKVLRSLTSLLSSPYLYQIADEYSGIRKCPLYKNCSMYYKVDNDSIIIVCFWDNRQDPIF